MRIVKMLMSVQKPKELPLSSYFQDNNRSTTPSLTDAPPQIMSLNSCKVISSHIS